MSKRTISEEEFNEYQALRKEAFDKAVDPVISKLQLDDKQQKKLRFILANELKYQEGQFVPVDTYGLPVYDAHGFPLETSEYIMKLAGELYVPSAESDEKKPRTNEELFMAMKSAPSTEERKKIYSEYKNCRGVSE